MANERCKNISHPRNGKTIYIGSDWRNIIYGTEKKKATVRIVYEIIDERSTDKYGQFLLDLEQLPSGKFDALKLEIHGSNTAKRRRHRTMSCGWENMARQL